MADLRVLVVGASIAGPATAYWLSKAGAKVTVIERWPKFREGGHNVDLRSCGITVMSKMAGMEAAVRAKKCKFEAMTMVHADGRPIITFTSSGKVEAQSLMSEYEIFRGDLSRVIMDLTKDDPNVEYVFGEQVTAIQQDGNGGPATVTFMNGYPSAEFDLVVACDGATSKTRAIGLECGLRDYVHPLNTWWAYFSVPGDLLNAKNVGLGYTEAPGKSTFVLYDATGNRTRGGFMSVHPRNDPNALAHFHAAKKLDTEGLKKYVAERFTSPAWKVPELIDALMQSDDLYVGELVQIKAPTLHRGRFVLVGDAGYSTGPTGGGTSMALAGAYILAGEILQHKGDLPAGLRAYEDRMRPIIKDLQTVPPGVLAAMGPQTEWGLWVRNLILGIVNWGMKFGSLFSWMGGWYSSAFAGDKFGLPEYEWVR